MLLNCKATDNYDFLHNTNNLEIFNSFALESDII
jgi:hypothetical protein